MNKEIQSESLQNSNTSVWYPEREELSLSVCRDSVSAVDPKVVHPMYYNSFNYSKLPIEYKKLNLTLGVTSARRGEGKTHIASNIAVSFATAYKRKTVLIDMNTKNPCLHKVFGTPVSPGLIEAVHHRDIKLYRTQYDRLFLLPVGNTENSTIKLDDILGIRDLVRTLEKAFDFIIIDMSSVLPVTDFPVLFANEVDGLITVVDTQKTKRSDINEVMRHLNENQIAGFIFNRLEGGK